MRLGVNVDHIATIREARGIEVPDPVAAASRVEINGADLITVHRRLDERHICDRDLEVLRETVKTPLNLEMALSPKVVEKALEVKPYKATLVPEDREEVTTEGGLDVLGAADRVEKTVRKLQDAGVEVALFVDPNKRQLRASREAGASGVELHTGDYAETASKSEERFDALERLGEAAEIADGFELEVCAGHGLNYRNTAPVAALDPVVELNIGHAIVSRAVMVGIGEATRQMKDLIMEATDGQCVE